MHCVCYSLKILTNHLTFLQCVACNVKIKKKCHWDHLKAWAIKIAQCNTIRYDAYAG